MTIQREPERSRGEVMSDTLGDALPREMARVRDDVIPVYDRVPMGHFAAAAMRHSLGAATKALAEGDVIAMLRAYEDLKGYEL